MTGPTVRVLLHATLPLFIAAPVAAQELTATQGARRIEALQLQQCLVQQEVRGLRSAGADRDQAIAVLRDTKNRMHAELSALEAEMGMTPTLQVASDALRDLRLAEKILYTQGTIEHWDDGSERTIEAVIQGDLAAVRATLLPTASPVTCESVPA